MSRAAPRFLVIRRDNIGDLLCTTPLLRALRERHPDAWIGALVNSYNAPVLTGNDDVDAVFAYEKAKHRRPGTSLAGWAWGRLAMLARLRAARIDYAILAAPGFQESALRFARLAGPRHVIGYADPRARGIDLPVAAPPAPLHEVEATFRLLEPLGIGGPPPAMRLAADLGVVARIRATLPPIAGGPVVGLHLSARKPQQRWPVEYYAELARSLVADGVAHLLLFWAPGPPDDPLHPGDDDKAADLVRRLAGLPVSPVPTGHLSELIAGLSLCDSVILSDGGAMHVAAALGKPLVCFFGNSDAGRWRPWGVAHRVLQKERRVVADISVAETLAAWHDLAGFQDR